MLSYEVQHALRYAEEAFRRHVYETLLRTYPRLFRDHVVFEFRPADSERDYVVPPGLEDRAIVVERFVFDETGCGMIACYPFREDMVPCDRKEGPRWLRLGKRFSVACQPACRLMTEDTDYRGGRCLVSNPMKKAVAAMPESLLGTRAMHPYHTGIDLTDGHLRLNAEYCRAYGLTLTRGDCRETDAQFFGEIFVGSTVYRTVERAILGNPRDEAPPFPERMPDGLDWMERREGEEEAAAPSRRKRSAVEPPWSSEPEILPERLSSEFVREMAVELAIDHGVNVTADEVARFLGRRVPGVLDRIRAGADGPLRHGLLHVMARSQLRAAATLSRALSHTVRGAGTLMTALGIVTMMLDELDPYEYKKVLEKKKIDGVDRRLDLRFFRSERFEVERKPYDVWLDLRAGDRSQEVRYVAERVREYLLALKSVPSGGRLPRTNVLRRIRERKEEEYRLWKWTVRTSVFLVVAAVSIVWIRYLEYFCALAFFVFVGWM